MWNYSYYVPPFKDYGIKTVTIGDGITSIGESAFAHCSGLTELTLPNSVTSIGEKAFSDCSGLSEITSLAEIPPVCGSNVFYGVNKTNCELIVPEGSVAAYKQAEGWKEFSNIMGFVAFGRCGDSIIWTLDDSGNLTLSGSGEMWNYSYYVPPFKDYGIKTVTIGDGITSIGESAFAHCSGLTELTLPNSVTSIGEKAFSDCSGLSEITSLAEIPPVCGSNVFYGVNKTNCELIVPEGSVAAYKQAEGWKEFSNIMGFVAFGRCGDSIIWTLDDSGNLTLSGSGEMWNYSYYAPPFKDYVIKTVTIGDGITSIGACAFWYCTGMTELTLSNSLTSIGEYAFYSCRGLTELTLPNSITSIGKYAFKGCRSLTKLTLPNSVTSIGNSAFEGCSGLTELTLPNSVTSIGWKAFEGCTGLTELTLPNSVTSIWEGAFFNCSGLTKLTLPNSVTSIGNSAFEGCTGLTELTLPSSITSIGEYAFKGCSGLTELTLPSSITSIGEYAFKGCSGLTELTLPNSVTSIGWKAFEGCTGLTELTLPDSLESIVSGAFRGCTGLSKITSLAEIPPVFDRCMFVGEEFGEVNKANCELIVPEESITAYKQAKGWNEFSNIRGFAGEKK